MTPEQHLWTKMFSAYYGDTPPWDCYFCPEPILTRGRNSSALNRHHLDGNQNNNTKENLKPAHQSCHSRHTKKVTVDTKPLQERGF